MYLVSKKIVSMIPLQNKVPLYIYMSNILLFVKCLIQTYM